MSRDNCMQWTHETGTVLMQDQVGMFQELKDHYDQRGVNEEESE